MNAVEIRNLTRKYRDTVAVDNLTLDIKQGELFSLLGIIGAGKTTTIKILVRLFEIQYLPPGMTIFELSFMSLFSAGIIAREKLH